MDYDATWCEGRPRARPPCVTWGPSAPPKGAHCTAFSVHVCCGQTAGWIKMPLGTEICLGAGHIEFNGDPAPPKKGTAAPQFLAHVYCGETAAWIKMPLGMEVGLGPRYIVLDADQAPPPSEKGTAAPTFRPLSIVTKRLDESRCHLVRR